MGKPDAQSMADALMETHPYPLDIKQAAAELRRLHAENERLHQINKSHEMKLSVRGYEIQIADLAAQRDALLEALRWIGNVNAMDYEYQAKARAAIKAVEEWK